MADNDTDISKTHLNKADQIIKVDFYLRLQNTKNFVLSESSWCVWDERTSNEGTDGDQ